MSFDVETKAQPGWIVDGRELSGRERCKMFGRSFWRDVIKSVTANLITAVVLAGVAAAAGLIDGLTLARLVVTAGLLVASLGGWLPVWYGVAIGVDRLRGTEEISELAGCLGVLATFLYAGLLALLTNYLAAHTPLIPWGGW